jgi:hypothetical protein
MTFLRGDDINLGFGSESTRGTLVSITDWIRGRTPSGINVEVIKTPIKETKASGIATQGSEVVQRRASGDLEFNVRVRTIGYVLKSLLGKVTSAVKETTAYNHTFAIKPNDPQFPTLSAGLSQKGQQDYGYNGAVISSLEIRTPTDDVVNATINMIARDETEQSDYTPAYATDDYLFRPQDVTIKIASTKSGLDAASALSLKEFALTIANNAQPNQVISAVTPNDILAGLIEISGSFAIDYEGDTYHDYVKDGTTKALRIEMERTDKTIGASSTPKLRFDFANVTFESNAPDRPLDDIARDVLSFTAHYDDTEGEAVEVVLTNEKTSY